MNKETAASFLVLALLKIDNSKLPLGEAIAKVKHIALDISVCFDLDEVTTYGVAFMFYSYTFEGIFMDEEKVEELLQYKSGYYVMLKDNLNFYKAVDNLADKYGIDTHTMEG